MGRLLPLILSVCPYVCHILSLGFSHLIITPGFISPGFISPVQNWDLDFQRHIRVGNNSPPDHPRRPILRPGSQK
jgi:hypothetical protein